MSDRRFMFGVVASFIWVAAFLMILVLKHQDVLAMTPNAWGDYFAGCFAPLAFLWLVLGYLQQGEELRLSTEALCLQATELRNSVEQQRALVEVSRLQVEAEREALAAERRNRLEEAKPKITLESGGGMFRGDGQSTYPIIFSNAGNVASRIFVELRHPLGRIDELLKAPAFERGAIHRAQVQVDQPNFVEGATITVRFDDRLGNSFEERYLITRQSDDPHAHLRIARIEA